MAAYGSPGFLHLNVANAWPGLKRSGLELRSDGSLSLFSLPLLESPLPPEVESATATEDVCGIAIAWDKSILYTDPANGRLLKIAGCSGESCVAVSSLDDPGAIAPLRGGTLFAIACADSIHIFDIARNSVTAIWPGIRAAALASDNAGNIWAAEGASIRHFDITGELRSEFMVPRLKNISALAYANGRLFALGLNPATSTYAVVAWTESNTGDSTLLGDGVLQSPAGLAVSPLAIYVGDDAIRRIFKFSLSDSSLIGTASGYRGPVAALALDGSKTLWALATPSLTPLALAIDQAFSQSGVIWGAVQPARGLPVTWGRTIAHIIASSARSHFQFYTAVAAPNAPNPSASQPFASTWTAKGLDVGDFFTGAGKSAKFWVGLHLFSDGSSSPVLDQIRVEYDQPTYLSMLPPIYRDQSRCGDFLLRFLSLFESFFTEGECEIRNLPIRFDPNCAPLDTLPWLASWLAIDWDERWDEPQQREVIRRAFALFTKRGTIEGLREALRLFAGVECVIEEPIRQTAWWSLPAPDSCTSAADTSASILNGTTATTGIEPQGAVVGVSAVLDRSLLTRDDDYGTALFDEVANRFTITLYRGQVSCPGVLDRIGEIIDRERPAHTDYRICIVEPRMAIGTQARVGIDAVVGGTPAPTRLGDSQLVLGGTPAAPIGSGLQLGLNSQI
jgi:phage tail-like protein